MEVLLNLVWLAIAIGALARLRLWARGESDRRRIIIHSVATVCTIALLFPIISVTDDIQAIAAAVEETTAVRRIVASVALQVAPAVLAVITPTAAAMTTLSCVGQTEEAVFVSACALVIPAFSLRGPPSSAF